MTKDQEVDFEGYVDPKPAGPSCKNCLHCEPNPEMMVLVPWCWKRDMQVNPLGTCNHWKEEPVEVSNSKKVELKEPLCLSSKCTSLPPIKTRMDND